MVLPLGQPPGRRLRPPLPPPAGGGAPGAGTALLDSSPLQGPHTTPYPPQDLRATLQAQGVLEPEGGAPVEGVAALGLGQGAPEGLAGEGGGEFDLIAAQEVQQQQQIQLQEQQVIAEGDTFQ